MSTIVFKISIKCQFIFIFQRKTTSGGLSMDQFGEILVIDDVFHSLFI